MVGVIVTVGVLVGVLVTIVGGVGVSVAVGARAVRVASMICCGGIPSVAATSLTFANVGSTSTSLSFLQAAKIPINPIISRATIKMARFRFDRIPLPILSKFLRQSLRNFKSGRCALQISVNYVRNFCHKSHGW
ncbi:MAG: hypothetical protein DPW16_11955 [Chloroflexi bacterium]|nr:hypothetical protein [Chloroflexota bacterium]